MTLALTAKALLLAGIVAAQQPQTAAQTQPPPTQPPPTQTQPPPKPTPPATPQTGKDAPQAKKPEPAPFPPDAKFAFVSLQYVVSESKYGKQGSEELKKFQETRTATLQAMEKEIEGLKAKLNAQQSLMSKDALTNLQNEIVNRQRKLQFETETAQGDIQRLNEDLLEKFQAKVLPIVEAIRKERNLHVIFAQQNDPGGLAVIAFDPGLDLSAEVVKRLDAGK